MSLDNQGTLDALLDDMIDNFLSNPSQQIRNRKKMMYTQELNGIPVDISCKVIRLLINDPELQHFPKIGLIKLKCREMSGQAGVNITFYEKTIYSISRILVKRSQDDVYGVTQVQIWNSHIRFYTTAERVKLNNLRRENGFNQVKDFGGIAMRTQDGKLFIVTTPGEKSQSVKTKLKKDIK